MSFALPPLLQLRRVPTLRVLRRELGMPHGGTLSAGLIGFCTLAGLMLWVAGDVLLGGWVIGGFAGSLLVFSLIARVALVVSSRLRNHQAFSHASRGRVGWRHGLASLERRVAASVVQVVALALGLMALLLLTVIRSDLLAAWQRSLPREAPNRFVINIQPEQVAPVRAWLAAEGLPVELAPMVRGRLMSINGVAVSAARYTDERAQRLIEREFNLSMRADLPPGNRVTTGRWFVEADFMPASDRRKMNEAAASVEEGLAHTLGLNVGDQLQFFVAGEPINLQVVGLRKVDWDTMRANFFVLTPPGVLDAYPASWITSFHLSSEKMAVINRLIAEFPNLTVIDIAAIVRQLQTIIEQVAQTVQFIFLFTVAAGLIVLYAALVSAAAERRYELAVMRALGARRRQLQGVLLAEFAVIGGLAGMIAALGAIVVGQFLAQSVFHFALAVEWWLPLFSALGGALLVSAAGGLVAIRLLRPTPLEAMRAGGS